ncbi:hypothetical protein EDB89DRAFT_1135558 [Lactarius sanguifluus]|nr:hypothetical protein EDB89DRAFT_1135558 [Lactarius sanguifluus]
MLFPSRRVLEAAEASSGSPETRVKRKAPSASTVDRHVIPKTTVNLDDVSSYRPYEADDDGDSPVGPTRDVDDLMEPQIVGNLTSNNDEPIDEPTMADAGHEVLHFPLRGQCTADLRLIFRRNKAYQHPDTGETLDGNLCTVCAKDPSIRRNSCFLTGSTSTLRMHIAGHHLDLYRKCCKIFEQQHHPD